MLPPPLLPQELQRYDPLDVKLRPLVPGNMAGSAPHRPLESLLVRARSTEYLPRCYRKRCAPNLGKWLPLPENAKNCGALTTESNPTQSGPLPPDYAQRKRESLRFRVPGLMRSYHSASLLVRSLPLSSLGKRRSLRDATRIGPHSPDT